MPDDPTNLRAPTRADLIHAISQAMLWRGKRRTHHWDRVNAQVAAENLIDNLARANFVILQGAATRSHGQTKGSMPHWVPQEETTGTDEADLGGAP